MCMGYIKRDGTRCERKYDGKACKCIVRRECDCDMFEDLIRNHIVVCNCSKKRS